ncbi:GEVED domain-containing protein [Wenyingzhuangia sp. chi5]|uniref:GEVED domain-containing protein n=1 Tax=Wenyingzhuangia gilva TaxID=3057677 RepID=A0ABT8VU40_9FLAO|nr:GEVED domain-containing protein [Wenyingzhuangia sp. chi5]MDO3695493.1 GEVED domain-containing protein [Wenyingzhuangia sp. chi5]
MKIKSQLYLTISFILFAFNFANAQTYTDPINISNNNQFYITRLLFGDIDNNNTNADNKYTYYGNSTTSVNKNINYTGIINYRAQKWNTYFIKIWIDYNNDGDFVDVDEEIYSFTEQSNTNSTNSKAFSFTIPSGAATATTRMRMAIKQNGAPTPQDLGFQNGEVEDYNINILPVPTPPTSLCVGNLDVNLDVSGSVTITPSQINNGSFDDVDAPENLKYSLSKSTFNCENIGSNTVTLTVTDTNGLTDSCTATVNVSPYSGSFTAPILPTIEAYCSYTAVAPIMDYQCGQLITATTTDNTTLTSSGTITWKFDNGSNIQTSLQTINITTPTTPTNITSTFVTETTAKISWDAIDDGPFKVRYKRTNSSSWLENTTNNKYIDLSNLDNGSEYEVQISVDASCATFTNSITFNTIQVEYCVGQTSDISKSNDFYISETSIGTIKQSSTKNDGPYIYYNDISNTITAGENLTGTVTYQKPSWATPTVCSIWIDYNKDGDFDDGNELVYSNSTPGGITTVIENLNITIPTSASSGKTRIRVAMSHNTPTSACQFNYEEGDIEDYDLYIRPVPTAPTAVCVGNININLDVAGNVTITPDQIDNGSYDDFDAQSDLTFSLDKTTFTCNDLGDNAVTLTVTDPDGLSDSCTAIVNISPFSGAFTAPNLEDIEAYCTYTAIAPVMDYLCGTQITATTSEPITLTSSGTITWLFNNGSTTAESIQNITIKTPTTPTNLSVTNITETTAIVNWDSVDNTDYIIEYRETGSSTWLETTSSQTNVTLIGLNNGEEYEVRVSLNLDSSCGSTTTSLAVFNTIAIQYCNDSNANINLNTNFYISNTNINSGQINQVTGDNSGPYQYFSGNSATVTAGGTISGTVTYQKSSISNVGFIIWIDFNQDGDFEDAGEEIYSSLNTENTTTVAETFSNISIPNSAATGKTRIRFAMLQNQIPLNACNYSNNNGDIEDYDLYIEPRDTTPYESAMITQVYHTELGERWIEITNKGAATIPTNTVIVALYKNTSGDQTGISPSETYIVNTSLDPGATTLIKSNTSSINVQPITPLDNNNVTNFDGADDIIAIVSEMGNIAWENRFDVVSNIENNSSYVRNDDVLTYNNTYTASEWTAFVNDNLDPYRDQENGGPERHPNAPLLSEVTMASTGKNIRLGEHYFGSTTRTSNAWSNGTPDRSRYVIINENYEESSNPLKARKLSITGSNIFTITDQPLIISNNININLLASLRLAGTSQLIQTHTGIKQLTGSGKLFIDRKTTNPSIYRYSFFSSPVNSIGQTIFTLEDILKDGTIPTSATSQIVDINFVGGKVYDGAATSPITIADYWVNTYKTTENNEGGYVQRRSNLYMQQTDGFTMKGTGVVQNYTYVGTPKDGTITTSIAGEEHYLTGNPYPSALSAKKFLEDNENVLTGTLYFWEHVGEKNATGIYGHDYAGYVGGYATRNKTMGLAADQVATNNNENNGTPTLGNGTYTTPEAYIPVGQAFFVQGDADGGTLTFNNSQREYITEGTQSVFFKTAGKDISSMSAKTSKILPIIEHKNEENNLPIIKLGMNFKNIDDKNLHRQIGVSFNQNNSFAYDPGYDSESYNDGKTDIYWKFPNDEKKYAIAGVQEINDELEVPLEIVMGYDGEIKISIDEWQNINRNVYLKDKNTEVTQLISNEQATLNLIEGTYTDRFVLAFKEGKALNVDELNTYKIYTKYLSESNRIIIQNDGVLKINDIVLFNIVGQKTNSWSDFTDEKNININLESNIAPNIYILKIYTDKGEISKKIYIQKKS